MKNLYLVIGLFVVSTNLFAQVAINTDGSAPHPSAGLDVKFNNKGLIIPRLTFEQRNTIVNPVEGLMVYCTTCNTDSTGVLSMYQGGKWINFTGNCPAPIKPVAGSLIPSVTQIIWNWKTVPIALGYKWNTVNNFNTATDMGKATSKTETGLACWTTYSRYVWAYNACGPSSALQLTQTTLQIPFSPAPISKTHVSTSSTIIWNWSAVSGAFGYKWNTINDFTTATDMGTSTSKTETGLTCNNNYTRFVWAYDDCGYSIPVTLTQSTQPCWVCGDPFTIIHTTGGVAPVDKYVSYGTVTNIPGELTKCWITQNLGASQQATALNDATEASAGWYWQFNRMQGYMHDGTTRTPNTTWINSIDENLDWQTANDPCLIEMGTGWRLPTLTEWTNVDAIGGWVNETSPWNSDLKMHAAGYLVYSNGLLVARGSTGIYWSSTQSSPASGWVLLFGGIYCYIDHNLKTYGCSVRCLRD